MLSRLSVMKTHTYDENARNTRTHMSERAATMYTHVSVRAVIRRYFRVLASPVTSVNSRRLGASPRPSASIFPSVPAETLHNAIDEI